MRMLPRLLLSVALVLVVLPIGTPAQSGQRVFVGIAGSRCEFSTGLVDANSVESVVDTKKYWASGFLDGVHAALRMEPVRSSINFTYARLQDYCGRNPNKTLREAMLALGLDDAVQAINAPGTKPSTVP
jgi:hypothetical protein